MKERKEAAILTAEDVMARWAYSELNSSRFRKSYKLHLCARIIEEAEEGRPFEQVSASDRLDLVAALGKFRGDMVRLIRKIDIRKFELHLWDAAQLLNCHTLPIFGKVRFFRFLAMPPILDSSGKPQNIDPRRASASIPFDQSFQVEGPVIAIQHEGCEMLIDGYLRSILWLRNPAQPLAVWASKP